MCDTDHRSTSDPPRILVFTTLFPNPAQPRLGVFVRERVAAVGVQCPTRVVAPVLSRLGLQQLEHGRARTVPLEESQGQLHVYHPRFHTIPGVGRFADGALLYRQTVSQVRRLQASFPFDVIDAHYAFPDGAAAILLGRRFRVPVCVTVRGGDIDLLPRFRMRRYIIGQTLGRATRVFAVSQHLATKAVALGAHRECVHVVANGIDAQRFHFRDMQSARQALGINWDGPLVLCVANMVSEKGHHVLVEAFAHARNEGGVAARLVLIGSDQRGNQTYRQQVEQRVRELGLSDRVELLGDRPQDELAHWYGAADVVVLPTFREGCPNVVREALACGAPVVASRVGGVPELVTSGTLGLLVEPGDVDGLAAAISTALRHRWDRAAIAAASAQRTWQSVAEVMVGQLSSVVRETAWRRCQ
jgi:teichuronic acid biosynthesis glycosyltransferase TuaC